MRAQELRQAFTDFFVERGHRLVPSAGLIPHHPRAPLFTNAGMNQFLPFFTGEEPPPDPPRATSVQKAVRIMGRHDDIENIGRTWGHFTFFEMLGNFSFGDYFKEDAIAWAWEFVTERLGLDGDRVWATVHHTDKEAPGIWRDTIGLPESRIVALGQNDDENFWEMGETGPCGPCSEIHYDMGPEFGPEGDPVSSYNRYREIWNLVFMQYERQPDGSLVDLPNQNIDTGEGLERTLSALDGVDSAFDTDELRRILETAERETGKRYGADPSTDVELRILTDHARSVSFLVSDGVFPSNEDRGYVLRRLLRRAVEHASRLGVEKLVLPTMVASVVEVMGEAYPELARNADFVVGVVEREESKFRQTLKRGHEILDEELSGEVKTLSGQTMFLLHDTYGFPRDLTREIAEERGVTVDLEGFEAAMTAQRQRARAARRDAGEGDESETADVYRELLEQFGPTGFTGYSELETKGRVIGMLPRPDGTAELFLDRSPFYAEAGGQVGDTGLIRTDGGASATVLDTTYAITGLHRHVVRLDGSFDVGAEVLSVVEGPRREAIRRNHTGTHLLHAALREVLGSHVRQHGSEVGPNQLRFDFSHYEAMVPEEIQAIENLANEGVLANEPVRAYETTKTQAEEAGALAFFGDKYGEFVRVIEAGSRSVELCGGTHVDLLGSIGPIKVVSEGSIGSNLRRVFAVTGDKTLDRLRNMERIIGRVAELTRSTPEEVPDALERLLARNKAIEAELKTARSVALKAEAVELGAKAGSTDGFVVERRDGLGVDDLRELALAVRAREGVRGVVLIGTPDKSRVALAAAMEKGSDVSAPELLSAAAKTVGGGGGGKDPLVATAGGRDASKIDAALAQARAALSQR
ncbi:MAG TPA: alanine--tRNA ligase [Acidimicrobiales bacterium]|nr:alanine--tRNA ligase [Acidimicrobiales bacterium]